MRDFTIDKLRVLYETLLQHNYKVCSVEEYILNPPSPTQKTIVLRHDVDLKPENSVLTARLEHTLGIHGTYYFRIVKESNQPEKIQDIANLTHEIGYHYEDLTLANGNTDKALQLFNEHLTYFRQFYPVSTICMHGSPRSAYDSKDMWKHADYHTMGIIAEPYLDIDFTNTFYLTDTGRRWDGYRYSVRDKVASKQKEWEEQNLVFHSTDDIIQAIQQQRLPLHVMITIHPQRWAISQREWQHELITQNLKNIVKRFILLFK